MHSKAYRVGLTYDLRDDYLAAGHSLEETAEMDKPDTIAGIEQAIRKLGHSTVRIGSAAQLVKALAAGERWDLVFNIAEGLYGRGREALVPALLDAYRIPYTFSDPVVLALTLDKAITKTIVSAAGLATAPFQEIRAPDDIAAIALPYPIFLKPVAEGTGKGISARSRVTTPAELRTVALELLSRFRQTVLAETFLPGREFTVGLAGDGAAAEALGVIEVNFTRPTETSDIYSYETKADYETRVTYSVPTDTTGRKAAELALAAWRVLGCRDAGRVDIRCDAAGRPNFIEVNPLAGLNPTHSDLPILCRLHGIAYDDLIARIVASAIRRTAQIAPAHQARQASAIRGGAWHGARRV
ncbi:MAG: D-alanine--D-alanine ligase [Kiritimatiellae bacterium]|nr:D-alanine--D-alanine ligase [Kiritimatiellia bacterium]